MATTTDRAGRTVEATRISCDCRVCGGTTILVPTGSDERGTGRLAQHNRTVAHNIVQGRRIFGYPVVD